MTRTWTADEVRGDTRFGEFVSRFDAGRYFAAHEVLEELWLDVEGDERDFLQGLVQIAVALEHRTRGNEAGALKVLRRARGRLGRYGARHAQVALEDLLEATDAFVTGRRPEPPRLADTNHADGRRDR